MTTDRLSERDDLTTTPPVRWCAGALRERCWEHASHRVCSGQGTSADSCDRHLAATKAVLGNNGEPVTVTSIREGESWLVPSP